MKPRAVPAPRSRLRHVSAWALRGLAALAALVVLAIGVLHTSWAEEKLRARLEGRLGERITTHATLGSLRVSLASGLVLEQLRIDGTDGKVALTIATIRVVPRWGRLIRGDLVLAELDVGTVHADLHGRADGSTNLTGVFRSGKPLERIDIEHLSVWGVDVTLDKPDGTRVAVTDLALAGAVRAQPPHRSVLADLELGVAAFAFTRPGLALRGTALGTQLHADLDEGAGPIRVGPTQGELVLERDGHAPYSMPLALASLRVTLAPGDLTLAADTLELAVLGMAAARIQIHRSDEVLAGEQSAALERIVVSAAAVNRLAERPLLVGDVTVGVSVQGPPEALALHVDVATPGGTLTLDGHVDAGATPRALDLRLTTRDLDVRKIVALETVPRIHVGVLDAHVEGRGESRDTANATFTAHAEAITVQKVADHEPIVVDRVDLLASLHEGVLDLLQLEIVAMDQTVSADGRFHTITHELDAHVATTGALAKTLGRLREAGMSISASPVLQSLSLSGPLQLGIRGRTDGELTVRADHAAVAVLGGGAQARGTVVLTSGDPARGEKRFRVSAVHAELDVRGISLATLGRLRGKPLPASGTVAGTVRVDGTPDAPDADVDLTVKLDDEAGSVHLRGALHGGRLRAKAQLTHRSGLGAELDVNGSQHGAVSRLDLTGTVVPRAGLPPVTLRADARIGGPFAAVRSAPLEWTLDLALPDVALTALSERMDSVQGTVHGALRAHGTRRDAYADLTVALRGVQKGPLGPLDADLEAHLGDAAATATLDTRLANASLAHADLTVDVGARGIFAAVARGVDPSANLRVQLPRRSVASLVGGAPLPGTFGGDLVLTGRVRDPKLTAAFDLQELTSLDGRPSHATLALDGSLDQMTAKVRLADALGLTVTASPRAYLAAKRLPEGAVVPVRVGLEASQTPVDRLLPKLAMLEPYRGSRGTVSADLHAEVGLRVGSEIRKVEALDLRGPLVVERGQFSIPGSSRVIHDVGLSLIGQGESIQLEKLEAHESDGEKSDRSLHAHGRVDARARQAELDVALQDVLLFGANFGQADAPRAALTGAVHVQADLAAPVTRVDVTVQRLELESPDRFLRAHQPEVLSLGDLVELGSLGESGVGRLRRQKPAAAAPVRGAKSLEIAVHVPAPIHLKQRPLDLWVHGDVLVERFGEARETTGTLRCDRGTLSVGGVSHELDHGEIRMSPEGPFFDVHFRHTPAPAALRDFATAGNTTLYAHMIGPLGRQKLTVSGVADSLYDALAINNGGRARVLTSPELPASQTAQLPQLREIRLTAYMGANLPHLAVLTRMNTYADPYANRFAYGRFQALEAERYTQNGKWRLRTTTRSPVIGQSEGEVEYDRVFLNTPRVVSGVGLLGGTRAGGGPAVFWEWSSAD